MAYVGKKPTDKPLTSADLGTGIVTSAKILDGTIANADVNDVAASKLTGALPAISGASLTGLNASNVATGTLADARISTLTSSKLSGALPAIDGSALTGLVAGGSVTDETDAYKNYSNITANRTLTLVSGKNYFLAGLITVDDGFTWTVTGT